MISLKKETRKGDVDTAGKSYRAIITEQLIQP